jgi:hypothetical protein
MRVNILLSQDLADILKFSQNLAKLMLGPAVPTTNLLDSSKCVVDLATCLLDLATLSRRFGTYTK